MEKISFTEQEIKTLIDGLTKWQNDDSVFVRSMLDCMLPKEVRESAEFKADEAERERKEKEEKVLREEQTIMLKAKLISLKQKVAVSEICEVK